MIPALKGAAAPAGIELDRFLLPLDADCLIFPGASSRQRLVLSQFFGLALIQAVAEMETALLRLKGDAWPRVPRAMRAAGRSFFREEAEHASMFRAYVAAFARRAGLARDDLERVLPRFEGSTAERLLALNSRMGGHAVWWMVALVEEASIKTFTALRPFERALEPLYFRLQKRHFEEESRHSSFSYALLRRLYTDRGLAGRLRLRADLPVAQTVLMTYIAGARRRLDEARALRDVHPFFEALDSCRPLAASLSPMETARRLLSRAPFVSPLINPRCHRRYLRLIAELGARPLPAPAPAPAPLSVRP